MMSRQLQISRTRESTFKHKEHLLGKTSQISFQFVSLPSENIHFVSQGHLLLLQLHDFFLCLINNSFQLGVLLFQLSDRSQLLVDKFTILTRRLLCHCKIKVLLLQSLLHFV